MLWIITVKLMKNKIAIDKRATLHQINNCG